MVRKRSRGRERSAREGWGRRSGWARDAWSLHARFSGEKRFQRRVEEEVAFCPPNANEARVSYEAHL